jgi:hypothetical protein
MPSARSQLLLAGGAGGQGVLANAWASFSSSRLNWFVQKIFYSEIVAPRHPMKIATIRLQ